MNVLIADIQDELGEQLASGVGGRYAHADVTDSDQVRRMVEAAIAMGPLRVLINYAGIGPPQRTVNRDGSPHDLGLFEAVVGINLIGTFNCIRRAAAYSASKGGIVGVTLPIARDLASAGIRVNTIAPGIIDTPLLAGLSDPAKESLGQQVLHPRRLGTPDEFAELALVTHSYVNGETIRMDGGIRMGPQ